MKLRKSQKLELIGGVLVLLSLLVQVFLLSLLENDSRASDEAAQNERLTQIFFAIKGEPERSPRWDEIDAFFKGPDFKGDWHFRAEEVRGKVEFINMCVFALGGFLGLLGKIAQFREENTDR